MTLPKAALLALALAMFDERAALAQGLRGKSVVVTWTEERMQRRQGETEYHPAMRQGAFSAYVGSTGRIFNRVGMTNPRRGRSGARDKVGDAPNRLVSLSGHTMTTVQRARAGGARRIVVSFSQDFTSCTAEVIRGKEKGADNIVAKSKVRRGRITEIASVKTSGVSCSVKDGNVFGQENP